MVLFLALAGMVALLVTGFGGFMRGSPPPARAIGVVRVTTSTVCRLPRLPAWTDLSSTTQVYGEDFFYHDTYEITYIQTPFVGITAWHEKGWLFAISTVFGGTSTAPEESFSRGHWPGHGALLWEDPKDWQLTMDWCVGGKAYHVHLTGLAPSSAELAVQVMAAWTATHASVLRCHRTAESLACRPMRTAS